MKSTLAERLIDAMNGPPKVSGVALAKACGVAPPSVSGWRTGDSKSLAGSNLLAAAKYLGVRPEWLADGVGPKYADKSYLEAASHVVREPSPASWNWPFKSVKPRQYALLDDEQREDIEKYVLLQVKSREPPQKRTAPESKPATVRSA